MKWKRKESTPVAVTQLRGAEIHPFGALRGVVPLDTVGFQSTHPVGGGTRPGQFFYGGAKISIHPPRGGWDIL